MTVSQVFEPDLPGTNDLSSFGSYGDDELWVARFSRPVIDPVLHIYGTYGRSYNFLGGLTPVILSGYNIVASGSVVHVADPGPTYDNSDASHNGYGSVRLPGTFMTLLWNRTTYFPDPRVLGDPYKETFDGGGLALSIGAAAVPEPGVLSLLAGTVAAGLLLFRRRGSRRA